MSKEVLNEIGDVLDVVEDRLDNIESELEVAETVVSTLRRITPYIAVAAGAFGALALGVYLAKRKYKKLYADLAEQEIKEAKIFYANMQKPSPEDIVAEKGYTTVVTKLEDLTRDYRSTDELTTVEILEDNTRIDRNIFDKDAPIWNYKDEEAARDHDKPYIISNAEFLENAPEHEQHSITYYEKDEVLADSRDEVINEQELLGEDNIRFGHGSDDQNIVYIRNELLNVDFEVARSNGAYAHEVLGFEHSDVRRTRKFRQDDD